MKDLIKRKDALNMRFSESLFEDGLLYVSFREVTHNLQDLPAVETEQVRRGKWINHSEEGYVECPFCESATNCDDNIEELHYCFSCGAKLDAERKEE